MDSIVNVCLLGIFVIVGFMLLTRLLRGFGGNNYGNQGPERPEYDDPDIQGGGSFGRPPGGSGIFGGGSERPTHNDPGVRGRGFFGGSGGSRSSGGSGFGGLFRGSSGGSRGSFNSPKVKGRGSFGGGNKNK
jgi:hypothetical protein